MMRATLRIAAWSFAAAVLLCPFFIVLYRLEVFNTLPRDDYAPYLMWLNGDAGGGIPDSPYAYRLLSVAAAWLLLDLMPNIPLSNIPADLPMPFLRATAALAMLSYLCMLATAVLTFLLARTAGRLDRAHALLAGALAWLLCWFTQVTAIDALALMAITAALCLIDRPIAFAALLLVSVGVNEKIALTLAIWLGLRCLLCRDDRERLGRQALTSFAAVALYSLIVALVHRGGNDYQLQPTSFPQTVRENLQAYLNARGVLFNLVPTALLSALALVGLRPRGGLFNRADILVIPALLAVALVLTHLFQAGRLAMHASPLFVVPAVTALRSRTS